MKGQIRTQVIPEKWKEGLDNRALGRWEKIGKLGTKDLVRWPYTDMYHRSGDRRVLMVRSLQFNGLWSSVEF